MRLFKIYFIFLLLSADISIGGPVSRGSSNKSGSHSTHYSQVSQISQLGHYPQSNKSGSGKTSHNVSVSSKISSGYRSIPSETAEAPKAPSLSKSGKRFEKEQLRLGKNNVSRKGFLEGRITNAGNNLKNSIEKQNTYEQKMIYAHRNPSSISSKIRSKIPGTMDYKHKQAIKQSNIHGSALTDVIHDTRIHHLYNGMSEETAQKLNAKALGALKQRITLHNEVRF